jgi:hypothetical protein
MEADNNQEIHKKKRTFFTQNRITILNECYTILQQVCKAGKIIFTSDYAKYNQYLLPSEKPEKKEEQTPHASTGGNSTGTNQS